MSISYIVPTLNEIDNIQHVYQLICSVQELHPHKFEIIFSDDNSTDGTVELINKIVETTNNVKLVQIPKKLGLGNAILSASNEATSKYLIFIDADCSVTKEDIYKIISHRAEDTCVIGSRYIKGSKIIGAPFVKVRLSYLLNKMISIYLTMNVADMSHSLRIIPNRINHNFKNLKHPGFFWELTIYCRKTGIKFIEVPITFTERLRGISKNKTTNMVASVIKTLRELRNESSWL